MADVIPGVVPAWAVVFRSDAPGPSAPAPFTVGSDAYDGSVTATLPATLAGGTYKVVVEGMTDADYRTLRTLDRTGALRAQLYLWWKDAPGSILGDLAAFTGLADPLGPTTPPPPESALVADLRVDAISRRAGERRYEVEIKARERAVARLDEARVPGLCFPDLDAALASVARAAGIDVRRWALEQATPLPDDPDFAATSDGTATAALTVLGTQVRDAVGLYGLPTVIVRDGVVHVGRWTLAAPVGTHTVDDAHGLVAVERGDTLPRDTAAGVAPAGAPTSRATVTLTMLGRPDLKPGDAVTVPLPPDDFPNLEPPSDGAALLVALTGLPLTVDDATPTRCRVVDVSHEVSRRKGFVTTVHATVLVDDHDEGWDAPGVKTQDKPTRGTPTATPQPSADPAIAAARAVHALVHRTVAVAAEPNRPRIGLVHDHAADADVPNTSTVWFSTAAPDGRPAGAQRTVVTDDAHGELQQVPYVTPFGWGNYGLVLPRYPGTRVLLADAGGGPGDLVDLGAVWARKPGGPAADAGDHWLVLPIDLVREHLTDANDTDPPDGPATHDLTDGHGNRLVETKRFTIRVTDRPTSSGSRPDPTATDAGSVLIETKPGSGQGARIELKDDGSVTITATKITFDAGQGDIALKANNVKVSVTGTMDVS